MAFLQMVAKPWGQQWFQRDLFAGSQVKCLISVHTNGTKRGSPNAGPSKSSSRVIISKAPSDLQPKRVDSLGLIPDGATCRTTVAFYTGRQVPVALNIAPPALLCAPEFGLIYDAVFGDDGSSAVPHSRDYEVGGGQPGSQGPKEGLS